jgi:hypothetical protein
MVSFCLFLVELILPLWLPLLVRNTLHTPNTFEFPKPKQTNQNPLFLLFFFILNVRLGIMCQIAVNEAKGGNEAVIKELKRFMGADGNDFKLPTAKELAGRIFFTCYLSTANNSAETRDRFISTNLLCILLITSYSCC